MYQEEYTYDAWTPECYMHFLVCYASLCDMWLFLSIKSGHRQLRAPHYSMGYNYTSKIRIHTVKEQDCGDKQSAEDERPYK